MGENSSFWFDHWSSFERIFDITGPRGHIDMGIPAHAIVAMVLKQYRNRSHRVATLNAIECEIRKLQNGDHAGEDITLWKFAEDKFTKQFSSRRIWKLLRQKHPTEEWYKSSWFSHAMPKYQFFTWLALHNRLTTSDRIQKMECKPENGLLFLWCG